MHRKYIYILTLAVSISLLLISAAAPAQADNCLGAQLLKQQIFDQNPSWTNQRVCSACHHPAEGIATFEFSPPSVTQFGIKANMINVMWESAGVLETSSPAMHADIGLSLEQELTIAAFMRSLPGSSHALAMSFFIPLVNR